MPPTVVVPPLSTQSLDQHRRTTQHRRNRVGHPHGIVTLDELPSASGFFFVRQTTRSVPSWTSQSIFDRRGNQRQGEARTTDQVR